MKNLYTKLLKFQKEVDTVLKTETNPFFKSKFANVNQFIETIKPILNELNMVVLQPLVNVEGRSAIKTIVIDADSGEMIEGTLPLIEDSNPQKMGSIISYTRRYALQSFLLLQTSDDNDGNIGSPAKPVACEKCSESFTPSPSWVKLCDKCKK